MLATYLSPCRPVAHRTCLKDCGLTLVELLVALAVSTFVAIAAVSALTVSRQGFNTVDAASQLRDNARFATELIQRLGVQTGYLEVSYSATNRVGTAPSTTAPNITGVDNALPSYTDPYNSYTTRTSGASGYGSDILILRFQPAETYPGSGVSDKTMIDCSGNPSTAVATDRDDRMTSVLYVDVSQAEPSLMCSTGPSTAQPIVRGVENFQVLYGVSGVIPNVAPTGAALATSVPDRYLRADQMVVAGDAAGTNANWARVRSLRIGMVLRGPTGSAQEKIAQIYYPLGLAKDSDTGTGGAAMSSNNDPGTVFSPGSDSRLRQTVTFTVHLRNELGL